MSGLYFGFEQLPSINSCVLSQGTFDGVHKGHQKVLQSLVEKARDLNLPSVLLTFHPHPRSVVKTHYDKIELINSIEEKAERILKVGVDYVLVLEFTTEISQLSPEQFVTKILVEKLNVRNILVGYDHRFGKNRAGGFKELLSLSSNHRFHVQEIAAKEIDEIAISSTQIRKHLKEGNITKANDLLGYQYPISGIVVHGNKNGRKLGFPTANIAITEKDKLIPKIGAYIGYTVVNGIRYKSMINIGYRPTLDGTYLSVESHLIGVDIDLYDQTIQLQLVDFLRNEIKFNSLDQLKDQLAKDKLKVIESFG